MKAEYETLISELDKTLSMIRQLWIDSETAIEKTKWRIRLDELLDERLRLMGCRDALKA